LFFVDKGGEEFLKLPALELHKVGLEGGEVGKVVGQIRGSIFFKLGQRRTLAK